MSLHSSIADAAAGRVPEWSQMGEARHAHVRRVATLMGTWAEELGLPPEGIDRWKAAGILHDALRDADPVGLAGEVCASFAQLPGKMLHGPAAAKRLRAEGVSDEPFLRAVAYHTIGHPEFDDLGRFLYVADFLEPGRRFLAEWRAELRGRMPDESAAVVPEIARARIRNLLEGFQTIHPETQRFWNVSMREKDA